MREYRIGEILPPAPEPRGIQGRALGGDVWYCFGTPPQDERGAKAWLEHRGVVAWYPTETVWRHVPRRAGRKKVKRLRTVVPRYIFARFTGEPQWDLLMASPHLSFVVGMAGEPLPISDATMVQMREVPQVLERLQREEIERRTIRPGDRARLPGFGFVVNITSIHAGLARFINPLLGGAKGEAPVSRLTKVER